MMQTFCFVFWVMNRNIHFLLLHALSMNIQQYTHQDFMYFLEKKGQIWKKSGLGQTWVFSEIISCLRHETPLLSDHGPGFFRKNLKKTLVWSEKKLRSDLKKTSDLKKNHRSSYYRSPILSDKMI